MGTHRRVAAIAIVLVVTLVIATAVHGSAASLGGVVRRRLSAGGDAVVSCDKEGVTVSYTVSADLVTEVTVSSIAPVCTFGQLSVTLSNSVGTSIGSGGPTTVTGTSHTLAMNPQPRADAVAATHVVIVGP